MGEHLRFNEYSIRGRDGTPSDSKFCAFRCFRSRLLADVVDAIWDWDIPDAQLANSITIKQAPGTSLLLIAQYRSPVQLQHPNENLPLKCAIQVQQSALNIRPTGPLGVIVAYLKPEAASRIVG